MTYQQQEILWTNFIASNNLRASSISYVSNHCTDIRIYDNGESIIKIKRITPSSTRRRINALIDEFVILKRMEAADIPNIPRAMRYFSDSQFEMLECSKLPNLPTQDPTLKKRRIRFKEHFSIIKFIFQMNLKGFSHGDIHGSNIGINEKGTISCFDFDQTIQANPLLCLLRDFFKIAVCGYACQVSIIDRILYDPIRRLKSKFIRIFCSHRNRSIKSHSSYEERTNAMNTPTLSILSQAWKIAERSNASHPGVISAYYSLDVSGIHFPGQRPWPLRWEWIRQDINFSNLRFLELGCNMGLLSTHIRLAGAAYCHGVDIDKDITAAASLIAKAFNCDVSFSNIDFDSPETWEDTLQPFDIVSCLSVMYWIKNKERFAKFLSRFNQIIFEGHATGKEDVAFISSLGYKTVRLLGVTERNRPLIHGVK